MDFLETLFSVFLLLFSSTESEIYFFSWKHIFFVAENKVDYEKFNLNKRKKSEGDGISTMERKREERKRKRE